MSSLKAFTFSQRRGFTLIEIMIVVGILGIVLAIAGPTWIRQREQARNRACQENLQKIDGAKEQWALENNEPTGTAVGWGDLVAADGSLYLRSQPVCSAGGVYTVGAVSTTPICSLGGEHVLQ